MQQNKNIDTDALVRRLNAQIERLNNDLSGRLNYFQNRNLNNSRIGHLLSFKKDISDICIPDKFTYPFYYDAHPLCCIAAEELQLYLSEIKDHDFFSNVSGANGGKMFGVLVVETPEKEIGYLAAFSGNLGGRNDVPPFVPPVYDLQNRSGFFKKEEGVISKINQKIKELEQASQLASYQHKIKTLEMAAEKELHIRRKAIKQAKSTRKKLRAKGKAELHETEYQQLLRELTRESQREKFAYKQQLKNWRNRIEEAQWQLQNFKDKIDALKKERKWRSASLQQKLFEKYQFLNAVGETKSAFAIFEALGDKFPPAGTGECAAPKLLQYAYLNKLTPIAMAEFWWGASPANEIRQHKAVYPSCRSKCEPLLGHMLKGLKVEENPLLQQCHLPEELEIVYEDDVLAVVNKPAGFLSVPGKETSDSVYDRMRAKYPEATGPLLVHRLDMSTSGLIVVAKTKEVHKKLQKQFLDRTVNKRYVALLDGKLDQEEGIIDLPIRVDLDDRPRQVVCYQYGKAATTKWQQVKTPNFGVSKEVSRVHCYRTILSCGKTTRVHFFPITGRTHQLRIHAAHPEGLNHPIIGDELYGRKADRLYLHAEQITFRHPETNNEITISKEAEF